MLRLNTSDENANSISTSGCDRRLRACDACRSGGHGLLVIAGNYGVGFLGASSDLRYKPGFTDCDSDLSSYSLEMAVDIRCGCMVKFGSYSYALLSLE